MSSLIENQSKNKYVFQVHLNFLLFALLLCQCLNLYNNNYNYNNLSDTTILNHNSFVRYSTYNLVVSDNFYPLDSHELPTRNLS